MGTTVKIEMQPTQKILLKRGLNKNGKAQQFFTKEVAKHCEPYIPFKTGRLKDTNTGFTYYKLAKIDLLYAEWK